MALPTVSTERIADIKRIAHNRAQDVSRSLKCYPSAEHIAPSVSRERLKSIKVEIKRGAERGASHSDDAYTGS
jgi:hypothetical protein